MNTEFTAIVKESDGWWIGWIEEIPGVNCQGKTKPELMQSLKEVLHEALEFNRAEAISAAGSHFSEERIAV
jgi:predicted RNase H-like HicB family nuclease